MLNILNEDSHNRLGDVSENAWCAEKAVTVYQTVFEFFMKNIQKEKYDLNFMKIYSLLHNNQHYSIVLEPCTLSL